MTILIWIVLSLTTFLCWSNLPRLMEDAEDCLLESWDLMRWALAITISTFWPIGMLSIGLIFLVEGYGRIRDAMYKIEIPHISKAFEALVKERHYNKEVSVLICSALFDYDRR